MKRSTAKRLHEAKCPNLPIKKLRWFVAQDRVDIRSDARQDASRDFHWRRADILRALRRLRSDDCYNTRRHDFIPEAWVDYYRARDVYGEDIYTHFYVHPESVRLVVNSFHKLGRD